MNPAAVATSAGAWLRRDTRRFDLFVATVTVGVSSLLILGSPEDFDAGWPEVAAGVGAFALLVSRRRWPLPLLGIAVILAAAHVALFERPSQMLFASIVLLASAAVRLDRWPAIGLGLGVGLGLYASAFAVSDSSIGDDRSIIGLVWAGLAIGVADATRSWRSYRESSQAQVRSAVLAAEAQTRQQVSEERLNIARELHDLLAHNLSIMNVQTGAALHLLRSNPDGAEAALTEARTAGRSVLDELRELLSILRHDEEGEELASIPTIEDLPVLVDQMRASGLHIDWQQRGGAAQLAPAVSLAAYRIAQEGLTNAAKHGDGSVELITAWSERGLDLIISNPVGPAPSQSPSGQLGLIGMRERAVALGGNFEADRSADRFVVTAALPAAASQSDSDRWRPTNSEAAG